MDDDLDVATNLRLMAEEAERLVLERARIEPGASSPTDEDDLRATSISAKIQGSPERLGGRRSVGRAPRRALG